MGDLEFVRGAVTLEKLMVLTSKCSRVFIQGDPAALILAIDVSAPALRGGHLEFLTQQLLNLLASPKR